MNKQISKRRMKIALRRWAETGRGFRKWMASAPFFLDQITYVDRPFGRILSISMLGNDSLVYYGIGNAWFVNPIEMWIQYRRKINKLKYEEWAVKKLMQEWNCPRSYAIAEFNKKLKGKSNWADLVL